MSKIVLGIIRCSKCTFFVSKQFELDMKQKGRCETPLEYDVLYCVK